MTEQIQDLAPIIWVVINVLIVIIVVHTLWRLYPDQLKIETPWTVSIVVISILEFFVLGVPWYSTLTLIGVWILSIFIARH
jgi:hypothetical protein